MKPFVIIAALLLAGCQNTPQNHADPLPPAQLTPLQEDSVVPEDRSLARCDGKDGSLIISQDLSARITTDKDLAAAMLKACARTGP